MFGSNDDKKAPQGGEKKGLFGWWRKSRKPASSLRCRAGRAERPVAEAPLAQ